MKYALNHPYKFVNSGFGIFINGLLRFNILIFVEGTNLLLILAANDILDVVINFVALTVIAEFDDIYYSAISGNPIVTWMGDNDDDSDGKETWHDKFEIERTTS
jgi:hypothetical protein